MLGNWQNLKIERYQVVGWFYAGKLADSETETYQVVGWFYAGQLADSEQKHIRWLDGSMLGNWQILNRNMSGGWRFLHRKKKVREFPDPSRDVTTKLSLGGNNDVITELFLPRGSLVSGPGWRRETREPFFTVYAAQLADGHAGCTGRWECWLYLEMGMLAVPADRHAGCTCR